MLTVFLFKLPTPLLLLPVLLLAAGLSGVKDVELIPPMPESSKRDLSDELGDDRTIRCGCSGTDGVVTKGFGVEVDTKLESSGINPCGGGGGGRNGLCVGG